MNKEELRWEFIGKFERDNDRTPEVDEIPEELKEKENGNGGKDE